jgi:hypothetical protein
VVKKNWRFKFDEVRQRFRLTPTERRVALFVLAAFLLGLVTKCYRDGHPSPAPAQTDSDMTMRSMSTSKKASVQPRDPPEGSPKSVEKLDLSDSATKQGHRQK